MVKQAQNGAATGVRDFLRRRRKAELQTIHQFWYPGESRLAARGDLEKRVAQALSGGVQLQERVARLSRAQVTLLTALLENEKTFALGVHEASGRLEASGPFCFGALYPAKGEM